MTKGLSKTALAVVTPILLSACGGGGVGSTPTPTPSPTPTPTPASYTKIADMTGNRTFDTGGVKYDSGAAGVSNGSVMNFGSGVTVAYTAGTDSYTLSAPGVSPVTFSPANALPPNPAQPNAQQWQVNNPTGADVFTLIVPRSSTGVPLSYTIIGAWNQYTGTNAVNRLAVGGAPTIVSDMPKTGTASYNLGIGGQGSSNGTVYNLTGNSTATFSANFATGQITTALTLAGTPNGSTTVTNFGTFNGTGNLTGSGPGFTGTLTGTSASGIFSGAFFGPQALEVGLTYFLTGPTFNAVGAGGGIKQ